MKKAPHNSGFTLIEVLISVAIALLLILGINQVFSIAQQTSGAGTVALAQVENIRAARQIMDRDFNGTVTGSDSPGIVIISEPIYAWRNRQDMLNSHTGRVDRLDDPANPTSTTGIPQSLTATNSRVHRIDRIMFFTRDVARRQTADANAYTSNTSWLESYVWYGHLALPINAQPPVDPQSRTYLGPRAGYPTPYTVVGQTSDFRNPGDAGPNPQAATTYNPNNFFASDWTLGRMPLVLVPFPSSVAGSTGGAPYETTFCAPTPGSSSPNVNNPLCLLGTGGIFPGQAYVVSPNAVGFPTFAPPPGAATIIPLYSSRYDMAFTSVDSYRQLIAGDTFWWRKLAGWTPAALGTPPVDVRFEANPIPQKPTNIPLTSTAAPGQYATVPNWMTISNARQAPMFLRGCSQFIVEFAGDFLTQDNNPGGPGAPNPNYGRALAVQPDGEIDYIVDNVFGQPVKRVRWYGFPRDVSSPNGSPDGHVNWPYDVVPLRDVIMSSAAIPAAQRTPALFERFLSGAQPVLPAAADYSFPPSNVRAGSQYICAWGWDTPNVPKPKMIRITIALDDPVGRLPTEQTFQYVFVLP